MNEPENMSIEPVAEPVKIYEGEVVEKTATWDDVRRSWSELRMTWTVGLERIKVAMEERARLRQAAYEARQSGEESEVATEVSSDSESACSVGLKKDTPNCAYSMGVFGGAMEYISKQRFSPTEIECVACGDAH